LADLVFFILTSTANFLLVTHNKKNAVELLKHLRDKGVLVRHFDQPRLKQYLRISIGLPEQNEYLLNVIKTLFNK
jgi:histidinol-phosphate aminotransferase